jgi:hypothetical protein
MRCARRGAHDGDATGSDTRASKKGAKVEEGLGAGFWLKVFGVILLGGLGVFLAFVLFERAWYRYGFLGASILFCAVLLGIAWVHDRRSARQYEDLA